MRVLLIGASGYVGQFLTKEFLSSPTVNLSLTYNSTPPADEMATATAYQLDLQDSQQIAAVIEKSDPDIVVNCAAVSSIGQCEKAADKARTVNTPKVLVEALGNVTATSDGECKSSRQRLLVHFSTDIVYEGDPNLVYDEESATNPVNVYGRVKADMDEFLKSLTPPPHVVILRPSNILGPQHPYFKSGGTKFLQWLDGRLRANETSSLFMDEFRNYVWVEDLVAVVSKLVSDFAQGGESALPAKLMLCGGPEPLSRVEVAKKLAAAKGHALTYVGDDGVEQDKIVPAPRAEIDLGYSSPLAIKMNSSCVEKYLGRPFRKVGDAFLESASRI